jgi:o-succinylbenzoate synthase
VCPVVSAANDEPSPQCQHEPMKLAAAELRRVAMPLVAPFRTSLGTEYQRDALIIRVMTPDGDGWGECVAMQQPLYSAEFTDGAQQVLRRFLLPRLFAVPDLSAGQVAHLLLPFRGHPMAKAAIEMAVLDAELRQAGRSLASFFGAVRDRIPSGVSVGIFDSVPELLDVVAGYLDAGYVRIKLKIEPGWDVDPVSAVRNRFGDELLLQVDANASYRLCDSRLLARLDTFSLVMIEQPLPEGDLRGHAEVARQVSTPICLDESITSARVAADAIALGACRIINVKPGRVGGYLEARRIAAVAWANGVPVWCGGMLETGIGRAANAALAACSEFTLPGDISASARFFARDITPPFVLEDGHIRVPSEPGIGVDVCADLLHDATTSVEMIRP